MKAVNFACTSNIWYGLLTSYLCRAIRFLRYQVHSKVLWHNKESFKCRNKQFLLQSRANIWRKVRMVRSTLNPLFWTLSETVKYLRNLQTNFASWGRTQWRFVLHTFSSSVIVFTTWLEIVSLSASISSTISSIMSKDCKNINNVILGHNMSLFSLIYDKWENKQYILINLYNVRKGQEVFKLIKKTH
jgi:hypothetical protein